MVHVRRSLAAATLALAAVTPIAAAPAAAGSSAYGELSHSGDVGLHWILDQFSDTPEHVEHPSVTCRYAPSGNLSSMIIQQPVLFAYVGEGPNTQQVRWRAQIQSSDGADWAPFDTTSTSSAIASGKTPADLAPKVYTFDSDPTESVMYRVIYRMLWFEGAGPPTGRAAHFPYWYRVVLPGEVDEIVRFDCPAQQAVVAERAARTPHAEPAGFIDDVWGPHTGRRGKHWILDNVGPNPELPSATCLYDENLDLEAVRLRRPIVFARNATGGTDTQDIGWRVRLQYTALNSSETDWQPLEVSSEIRRPATDSDWADFRPRTIPVEPLAEPFFGVRAVYQLTWYRKGTDTVRGTARHSPRWYTASSESISFPLPNPYCYAMIKN
jgi:hypothetical protein